MSLLTLCHWIENTTTSTALRESMWMWSVLETAHAVGIVFVLGTIWTVDLRLLGLRMRHEPLSDVTRQLLPWTWCGVVLMLLTGALLVWSQPVKLYNNPFFRLKLALLALAGTNALVFHKTVYAKIAAWDEAPVPPVRARLAGLCSLVLWIGVVAAGRSIGYGY
jgi:hypothetical protein